MIPILLLQHDSTTNNSVKMFCAIFLARSVGRKEGGRHGGKLLKLHLIQQAVQGGEAGRQTRGIPLTRTALGLHLRPHLVKLLAEL